MTYSEPAPSRPQARTYSHLGLAAGRLAILATAALLTALAGSPAASAASGGVGQDVPRPEPAAAGGKARLVDGKAIAPGSAPPKVKRAIAAANRIVDKPYCYGGGHARWESRCYDCSGTVSYALGAPGARLLDAPMPSGSFTGWGKRGRGRWVTVYANGGHMYVVIAGLRLDTSRTPGNGPGWSKAKLHQNGYAVRHPRGL